MLKLFELSMRYLFYFILLNYIFFQFESKRLKIKISNTNNFKINT